MFISGEDFQAHRLLQYKKGDVVYGSKKAFVNLISTSLSSHPKIKSRALLLPIELSSIVHFNDIISRGPPGAIVYMIPEDTSEISSESLNNWLQLELFLIKNQSINFPIYFTVKNKELNDLWAEVKNIDEGLISPTIGNINIYINEKEPTEIKNINLDTVQAYLPGQKHDASMKSIVISSYWDSLTSVPSKASGCNDNGSGILSILSIIRYFSSLYSSPSTIGRYNLLFLLSSGSKLDFEGTHQWLETIPDELRHSIEYAICLDSLSNTNDLFLHVSRPTKDPNAHDLYEIFSKTSKNYDFNFEVIQRKINIGESSVLWEHEQFARKKVLSVTLSSRKERDDPFDRVNLFDDYDHSREKELNRNTKFIIEVLSRIIYSYEKDIGLISDGNEIINEDINRGWFKSICSVPRMIPFETKSIVEYIKNIIGQHIIDVQLVSYKSKAQIRFFDKVQSNLTFYKAKPLSFDIILSVLVLVFNIIIYACLRGPSRAINDARNFFSYYFVGQKKKN